MLAKKYRELLLTPELYPVVDIVHEFQRLRLLENAVINYAGGLTALEKRIRNQADLIAGSDPATALLLNDMVNYLQDIALVGTLPLPEKDHD
jgi:hypothetical protein